MSAMILLVEDDPELARGVRFNLEQDGHCVIHAGDAATARAKLAEERVQLVLLDLNLPDEDGLDVLKELRGRGSRLPVICLTARGQETDVVMGLGLGADDYVKKPFGVAELLARVDAVLRRADEGGADELCRLKGGAVVDPTAHRVRVGDREEELTPLEMDLFRYLWEHRGRAVDRQTLLRELWGVRSAHTTRTLDNHVARLRRKLEPEPQQPPRAIVTVHGVGYRLEPDAGGGAKP